MTNVLEYLQSKGLRTRSAGPSDVNVACFYCGEDPNKRGRLYVNIDPNAEIPGLHFCHLCGAKGSLVSIQKHFGDATDAQEKEDNGYIRRAILELATQFYAEGLQDAPDIYDYLRSKRGLTLETIMSHRLGYAHGDLMNQLRGQGFKLADIMSTGLVTENPITKRLEDRFQHHITIPYIVSGNVVMIRGRDMDPEAKAKYVTPAGQKGRLFNSDVTWEADEVCVTEGEFDALVVEQLGYAAVGVSG